MVKTKENSKSQKQNPKKKFYLELLHQILGKIFTRSLLAGNNENVWQDIELRVDTKPFFTSCQISAINKKPSSKTPLKSKKKFKWIIMNIIPSISYLKFNKRH